SDMSPAANRFETSRSPGVEFLESTEDALSAFDPEKTAGKRHARGQRLLVRAAVLIGSLAVVLILVVVAGSRGSGGGVPGLIPTPSVVAALPSLPDPPRVPASPVVAADPTSPTSARQGPGTFKDDTVSQLKPLIAPKTTTTDSPGRTAPSGTSQQK